MLYKISRIFDLKKIISIYLYICTNIYCKNKSSEDNKDSKETVDFLDNNKLSWDEKEYPYSSTLTVGTSFGFTRYARINTKIIFRDIQNTDLSTALHLMGIRASYNILFSNMFFANKLGIFPRFGIDVNILGFNYLTRFFAQSPDNLILAGFNFFIALFKGFGVIYNNTCGSKCGTINTADIEYNKLQLNFLKKPDGIVNIFLTFEPETSIFEKVKIIPQIGIGPSLVFLKRNNDEDLRLADLGNNTLISRENGEPVYPLILDIAFSFKTILKVNTTNNYLNSFNLELGYTYNPFLLTSLLSFNDDDRIIEGGIWNFYLSLNYARHFNLGLETVEFFSNRIETSINKDILNEEKYNRDKKDKNTMFFDGGIGIGQWVDINNISNDYLLSRTICPMLQFSFSMPYYKKLSKNHYLSFIGVDANEDLRTGEYHNKDHNFFSALINNLSVTYNFFNVLSDYNGIKFLHKLGVYVPLLTNLISTITDYKDNSISSYFFNREMIGVSNINKFKSENESFLNFFVGKFCYKFKMYVDLFRLLGINFKYNTYFYFGGNTILFNRRNDYKVKDGSFSYELFKIESFNFGISFKFN